MTWPAWFSSCRRKPRSRALQATEFSWVPRSRSPIASSRFSAEWSRDGEAWPGPGVADDSARANQGLDELGW